MSFGPGSLVRAIGAPAFEKVSAGGLGFPVAPLSSRQALDRIPQAVVTGFEWGLESSDLSELVARLALMAEDVRGFGYEGATMACTLLDAPRRGTRTRDLLQGAGRPHLFLAYIGIGFAMARLPRRLWSRVLPNLRIELYHPTMSWLAVDGYGFDLAYFNAERWLRKQEVPKPYPWMGSPSYFPRAVDQGFGRAIWFFHGAQPQKVAEAVTAFPQHRRADLWSGVGLAATFAGPAETASEYDQLRDLAGHYQFDVAVGAAFAAKGRVSADFVPDHTHIACQQLLGVDPTTAADMADAARVSEDSRGMPAYEHWRQSLRSSIAAPMDSAWDSVR